MLQLKDFFHTRQAEQVIKRLLKVGPGLVIVAGPGGWEQAGRSKQDPLGEGFLPSGRQTILRTLVDEVLGAGGSLNCFLVGLNPGRLRPQRGSWREIRSLKVDEFHSYADRVMEAAGYAPDLVLVDEVNSSSLVPALEAARRGVMVISQLESPLRGPGIYRQLLSLGASNDHLRQLTWTLVVQRVRTLCTHCRRAVLPGEELLKRLERLLLPMQEAGILLEPPQDGSFTYSDAAGCVECQFSGRRGDVSVLDICKFAAGHPEKQLPVEAYLWMLVQRGLLPLDDLLEYDQVLLHQAFQVLSQASKQRQESNKTLEQLSSQLESTNRVLEQRNRAVFSFQDIGYALIRSNDLYELAGRICHRASELCQADRTILYVRRGQEQVEIVAVNGWDAGLLRSMVAFDQVFRAQNERTLVSFSDLPPGIPQPQDAAAFETLNGIFIPLVAQDDCVGAMVVQSTANYQFKPGEIAMVQAFANQAALALQRADLVADLRLKIEALEAAQAELGEKERMQREMELAHQVQMSVLPQVFPQIPGFRFASLCRSARQVGGDFYDVIDLDEDHFGLAIADVSDKGMPAALYMVLTRTLLVAQARRERSPSRVLYEVNQLLQELSSAPMFVTVFYAVVNKRTGVLRYARAGHDPPVVVGGETGHKLDGDGIAMGVVAAERFRVDEKELALVPGSRLVLYTDGLTDVFTPEYEIFGRARLERLLSSRAHVDIDAFCGQVLGVLEEFHQGTDQFDDMTMLVVDVTHELPLPGS